MGDIWLPGHPPAYTDWGACVTELEHLGMDRANAEILAAIGGPESGYDYTVINDTPATGDYSVGVWQINYLGSLYAERSKAYGTPEQMVADGIFRQAPAAYSVWRDQGWMAWSTTYTSGRWRAYIGSGPVPNPGQPPPGGGGKQPPVFTEPVAVRQAIKQMEQLDRQLIWEIQKFERQAVNGIRS